VISGCHPAGGPHPVITREDHWIVACCTQMYAGLVEAPDEHASAAGRLFTQVLAFSRVVHAFKTQVSSRSAHTLLMPLTGLGPMRMTALAEVVRADPSTTSRHVADLVREGLVARQPDPDDRRAHLLVVTEAGREVAAALRQERAQLISDALSSWSPAEVDALAADLHRFTTDLGASLAADAAPDAAPDAPPLPPATSLEDR